MQSERFDLILCSHVLEHIPDDRGALRQLRRVLRPGGAAVIQVPLRTGPTDEDASVVDPAARHRRFGQFDHVRFYGSDFTDRVRAAGFGVEAVRYAEQLGREEIERCRLDAGDEDDGEAWIFVARKP